MTDKIHHILKRFPEKSHALIHLMAVDSEFLTMCEDYDACVIALQHWIKSQEPESKTRVNEYSTIIRELEEEINQAILHLTR
jgi:hypothetical protein